MTDISKLRELLARVESAAGPDHEIDQLLGVFGANCADPTKKVIAVANCAGCTSSIDAAVQLCERVLPGWFWRVGHSTLYAGWATVNRLHPDHCDRPDEAHANAANPALALCAATIRAKIAMLEKAEA